MRNLLSPSSSSGQLPLLRDTGWPLAAAAAGGVLLVALVLALAPIFTNAIAGLGLRRELDRTNPARLAARADVRGVRPDGVSFAQLERQTTEIVTARAGWFLASPVASGSTGRGVFGREPEAIPAAGSPGAVLQFIRGYEGHVRLVAGTLPAAGADNDGAIHVAVGAPAARSAGLEAGDRLAFLPAGGDPTGLRLLVVDAVVEPVDPEEVVWQRTDAWFRAESGGNEPPTVRFFVPEATFFDAVQAALGGAPVTLSWYFPAEVSRLDARNAGEAVASLSALRSELPATVDRSVFSSPLDGIIERFQEKRLFAGLPVTALLVQVGALALFLVVTIGDGLARRRARTLALLRTRGAATTQVARAQLLGALLLATPAAALAPPLAALAVGALGHLPAFEAATGGAGLPASVTPAAWLASALGAAAASVALALPSYLRSRSTLLAHVREATRLPRQSVVHRYYIDVAILLAGLLLHWELTRSQGAVSRSVFGDRNVDPLLLFAPGLLAAGAGLVLLRLLPLLAAGAGRLALPFAGPAGAMLIHRLTRSSGTQSQIAILAMMTATLGVLSATFGSTIERSLDERAQYAAGADLRLSQLSGNRARDGSDLIVAAFDVAPDTSAFPATRLVVSVGRGTGSTQVTVLALDTDRAREVVPLREDFLPDPPAAFYDAVRGNRSLPPGRKLPGEPDAIRVALRTDPPQPNANAWLRLSDEAGRYYNVLLGPLASEEWVTATAELRNAIHGYPSSVTFPLRLQAIFFSNLGRTTTDAGGDIFIDAISVRAAGGTWQTVEGFEGDPLYQLLQTYPQQPDSLESAGDAPPEGSRSIRFRWVANPVDAPRHIVFSNHNAPIPAAASTSLMARLGLRVGDQTTIALGLDVVPVRIVSSFHHYPTIDPATGGMVVELQHLEAAALLVGATQRAVPNELWLYGPRIDREALLARLREDRIRALRIESLEEARDATAGDPLLAAGTGGLFLLGLGVVVAVAFIGLAVAVADTVARERVQAAVMRAMGLQAGQVSRVWWTEFTLALVAGAATGGVLGRVVGGTMLEFLAFDQRGRPVVPPYEVVTDWRVVAVAVVALAGCVVAAAITFGLEARRTRPAQTLRVSD